MKKMSKKEITKHNYFLILCFVLIFIIGLLIYDDYGVSIDEVFERKTGLVTLKYVLKEKLHIESLPEQIDNADDLLSYEDKDYGVLLQMPVLLFEYANQFRFDLNTVFRIRHLWVFLNFLIAVVCFCKIIQRRFSSWTLSILGIVFLIISPRIFADAFYNIKDLMFFSWFTISLFFYIEFILSPGILHCFLLALVIAVSANGRIAGITVLPFSCFYLLLLLIRKQIHLSQLFIKAALLIGFTVFFCILFLPASWDNPIRFLEDSYKHFSHYDLNLSELYFGKLIPSNAKPWQYLPVWIGITTPVIYLVLFFVGIISFFRQQKKLKIENRWIDLSFICFLLIPIMIVILNKSTLYNGWRHFYFIYCPFLYFVLYGFLFIKNESNQRLRYPLYAACLFSLLINARWMVINHPYQMIYFNKLIRNSADVLFERDYWALSTRESLEFLLKYEKDPALFVGDYQSSIDFTQYSLRKKDRDRLIIKQYRKGVQPPAYLAANYSRIIGNDLNFPFYDRIYNVKVDDMILSSVYQRSVEDELPAGNIVFHIQTNIHQDIAANLFDNDFSTAWTTGRLQNNSDYLEIEFKNPVTLWGMTYYLASDETDFPRSLQMFSSMDGILWDPIDIVNEDLTDYTFNQKQMKFLKMKNTEHSDRFLWSMTELVFHGSIQD